MPMQPNSLNWDCQLQEERMMLKPSFQSPPRVDPYMVKCMEDESMAWWRFYSAHQKHFGKTPEKSGTDSMLNLPGPINAGLWTNGRGNKYSTYRLVKQSLITSRHSII
jgi:hypothetical protein